MMRKEQELISHYRINTKEIDGMNLLEFADYLNNLHDVTYYYVSYRLEDILDIAKEESLEQDLDIFKVKDGYIAFQKGVVW